MHRFQNIEFSSVFVGIWNTAFRLCVFLTVPLLVRLQQLRSLERAARAEADAGARLKGRMIGLISREFGSVLTDFQTAIGILKSGSPAEGSEERRRAYEAMDQIIARWDLTISNFFNLTRSETGSLELERSRFPLLPVVREVLAGQAELINRKGLRTTLEGPPQPDAFCVDADPEALRLILNNLIAQAVRHAPPGGSVTVRVTSDPSAVPQTVVSIEDTRMPSASSAAEGVGLRISRELVESHGSRLESGPNEAGFRYSFRLPAAEAPLR